MTTRETLLAALEALLAEGRPAADLRPQDIATRAGVSRPTFYVHFRGRPQPFGVLAARAVDEVERGPGAGAAAAIAARRPVLRAFAQVSATEPGFAMAHTRLMRRLAVHLAIAAEPASARAVAYALDGWLRDRTSGPAELEAIRRAFVPASSPAVAAAA